MQPDEINAWKALHDSAELIAELEVATGTELSIQTRLRENYPAELVRLGIGLMESRRRGIAKFSRAEAMWFSRIGLEQSTSEAVARHKARRFQGSVDDLCAGIGGDTIALAAHCQVAAIDISPLSQLWVRWNAEVYGVSERVDVVNGNALTRDGRSTLFTLDPDRRAGVNERARKLEDYQPGVEDWARIAGRYEGGAIKISPASPFTGRFPDHEIELISHRGECKEAVIWTGSLGHPGRYRATVLPTGDTIYGEPLDAIAPMSELQRFIYDPDPAVVRAGMIDQLCVDHGYSRLDAAEEYLTSDQPIDLSFAQTFEVLACTNNNERRIRDAVRSLGFGQVEIKCRRVPIRAEDIRRRLPLDGQSAGVLIYCQIAGVTQIVLARRHSTRPSEPVVTRPLP